MPFRTLSGARAALRIIPAAVVMMLVTAASAAAQEPVHMPDQLTDMPKLSAPARAAAIINDAYPMALRNAGVGGTVQVQFVVGADGKVEPSSITVLASSRDELARAATDAVRRLQFEAGKVYDKPVRAQVVLPIAFRP